MMNNNLSEGAIASLKGNTTGQNVNHRVTRSQARIASEAGSVSTEPVDIRSGRTGVRTAAVNAYVKPTHREPRLGHQIAGRVNVREDADRVNDTENLDAELNPIEMNYRVRSTRSSRDFKSNKVGNQKQGVKRTRNRFVWKPIRERQQLLYDLVAPRLKPLRKLWRSVESVRNSLQNSCDQTPLNRGTSALTQVTGVIYAIYCTRTTRLYVGQTIKSASTI